MSEGHWLPDREQDLCDLGAKWMEWGSDTAKRTAFGWDAAACSNMVLKIGNFLTARTEYQADNSSAHLTVKNTAKKVMKKMMREFASSYIRFNPKMSDDEKQYMGVRIRDPNVTPQPNPTDHVNFTPTVDGKAHAVRVDYRIEGGVGHNKGRYHGVEVRFWVLPLDAPAPLSADDLIWRSEVNTATPWTHTFSPHEIGQRLYIDLRWENGSVSSDQSVGKGPWSGIETVVIS
jgi:hypothetical protein